MIGIVHFTGTILTATIVPKFIAARGGTGSHIMIGNTANGGGISTDVVPHNVGGDAATGELPTRFILGGVGNGAIAFSER